MEEQVPKEIMMKYPRTSRLTFPDGSVDYLKVAKAVFVSDHNEQREYWKGFEIVEWGDGEKELRVCYWTRLRGTTSWKWGQFSTIISLDRIKRLVKMIEEIM
ncbi:MAG: hypothetical protein OEZ48_04560 [Candidatus Bathyarchaeota archaeon]|nr:hypothetical protein [Candidatus Bathyarchaeota archaeon]MDH5687115.1 hypothetical protein [Candidatus Bathyarchaeota archaeon]